MNTFYYGVMLFHLYYVLLNKTVSIGPGLFVSHLREMKHSMPINDEERGLQYVTATISKDDSNGIAAKIVSNGSLPEVCQLKPETGIVKSIGHDGGWGWVIVGCAFCITAIVGGSFTAFSLLYIEFTSVFNSSKAVTGWIGSIYMASGMFLGWSVVTM